MTTLTPTEFEELMQSIRPELHRYATRMTGSVIDGEDVVQEALMKANASLSLLTHDTNIRGWLFRITHNKAIDYLRRYSHEPLELLDEHPTSQAPDSPLEEQELAAVALSMFLKLSPRQRSAVIFKDVMGYSLAEISELLNATIPEVKATLHRGRTKLREIAANPDVSTPHLDAHEQELLTCYVERFNARDFDTLRTMLTDEVRLDLVNRVQLQSADAIANNYFYRYSQVHDWRMAVGTVDGYPAILGYDLNQPSSEPAYFILLTWENDRVSSIHDFFYARYVLRDAAVNISGA